MPDFNGPLLSSLLMGQRQEENPFQQQRKYGRQLIVQGSSGEPLKSGNPLEGLARMLTAGVGGYFAGQANRDEDAQTQHNIGIYSEAAKVAQSDPGKATDILKGLKGGGYQQEALLGQILQNSINEGIKQQQAQTGITRGGYGGSPVTPGGGLGITVTPGQQPPGTAPAVPASSDNNIMNIRATSLPWEGKGAPQNGFETFATPQAGANATVQNFQAYIQQNPNITVAQAIAKWAPPNENNTNGYIQRVAEGSGINPGMRLADVMQNPVDMARLLEQGTMIEKGRMPQGVTPDVLVNAGQRGPQVLPQGTQVAQAGPPQAAVPAQSEGGNILRAQAARTGDKVEALALYKKAQEMDAENANKMGVQSFQQTLQQPNQNITNEGKLRDDFNGLQPVKDYRKAATVFRSAVEASKVNSAAADLNMVYAFATMMDPGSVVRDQETGMVIATQNATDRIKSLVATVSGGSRLSPESKDALINEMGSRYQSYKTAHDQLADTFGGIAERSGVRKENVVIPFPEVGWKPKLQGEGGGNPPPPPGFRPL